MNVNDLKKPRARRVASSIYGYRRVGPEPEDDTETQPMMTMYVDIETIPLPIDKREFMRPTSFKTGNLKDLAKIEAKQAEVIREFESGSEAGLDELQASIAVIGYVLNDEPYAAITNENQTEKQMLSQFWGLVAPFSTDFEFVGHNIRFDADMLIHRSWINGIKVPQYFMGDLFQFKPRHWRDTMSLWQLGNRQSDMRSLKHLCGAFGIPVKSGDISGANFAENWKTRKTECIEYNKSDVLAVKELWNRIGSRFS